MLTLLQIECVEWSLQISGRLKTLPSQPDPAVTTSIEIEGALSLDSKVRQTGRLMDYCSGAPIQPVFFENVAYDVYLTVKSGSVVSRIGPQAEFRNEIVGANQKTLHFQMAFPNLVGSSDLSVEATSGTTRLRFEVFPTKLDYRTDYVAMRDEVASIARQLVMGLQRSTFGAAAAVPASRPTLNEWVALIQGNFDQLCSAISVILTNPRMRLLHEDRTVNTDRARRVQRRILRRLNRRPTSDRSMTVDGNALPQRITESKARLSVDTAENRFVKRVLRELKLRLVHISRFTTNANDDADLNAEQKFFIALQPATVRMLRRVNALLVHPFLRDVTDLPTAIPDSSVFQFNPHYATVSRLARLLAGGLSVSGGPFRVGLQRISILYEYWCFLKLVEIVAGRLDLKRGSAIKITRTRVSVALTKGEESTLTFVERKTGRLVTLRYNRLFSHLPTLAQRPDNVIELRSGKDLYLFDAKYRIEYDEDYIKSNGGPGPRADDINSMHRYRDAIVIRRAVGDTFVYRRIVRGAVVLFPGQDETQYANHRFFRSIGEVQIGGLPFLPSTTMLARQKILDILSRSK